MQNLGAFAPIRFLYIRHVVCIHEPVTHDVIDGDDDYDDAVCGGVGCIFPQRPVVAFYVAS
jgi:hypothetical protein